MKDIQDIKLTKQENLNKISQKDIDREMKDIFRKDNLYSKIKKSCKKGIETIENKGINVKVFVTVISLLFLVVAFSIPIIPEQVYETYDKEVLNERVNITETVPERISFGELVMYMEDYDSKIINVTGYLNRYREKKNSGVVIKEVLTDDLGTEIILKEIGDFRILLPELGVTSDLYMVTGEFKRNYEAPYLYVKSIKPVIRDYVNVTVGTEIVPKEKITRREIVEPKRSIIKLLIDLI